MKKGVILFSLTLLFVIKPYLSSSSGSKEDLNVLLITLDTTRADRLGFTGYSQAKTPNLDFLASSGICFLNAYTSVPLTLPAHCSLLTGTYPVYHQVRNNGFYYLSPELITLAEIFKEKGYTTAAFVSSFTVDSRFGLDQGFDYYDDNFQEGEILKNFRSERRAKETFDSFSSWLDQNFRRRFFVWLHFYDPHLPYDPPSPFKEEFARNPYDGEIAYVDFYLGQLLNKLKEKGIFKNTLIVVTADHGEALGERREIDHGLFLYDNTLKIPLIFFNEIILPEKKKIASRVRIIDIAPTILDLLAFPIPKQMQGISLKPYFSNPIRKNLECYIETFYPYENFGWAPLEGLIFDEYKFIKAPQPELYNLEKDPEEATNLEPNNKERANKLNKTLNDYKIKISSTLKTKTKVLSSEEQEKLRSLGYIAGAPAAFKETSFQALPDPKDKIDDYLLYFQGNLHETRGDYETAVEYYQKVLKANPNTPWNYVNLGFVYMKMNQVAKAISLLEEARNRFPHSIVILSRLLSFYLRAERWGEALSCGQAILNLDPNYFDALFLMGSTLAKLSRWKEALQYYEKALTIEPENKVLRQRQAYTLMASGKYKEAEMAYLKLKADYPTDFSIDLDLAQLYEVMGKIEEATKILEQAVTSCPCADTYYAYAFHLDKIGRKKEAIIYLQKYLQAASENDIERRMKAQSLLERLTKK